MEKTTTPTGGLLKRLAHDYPHQLGSVSANAWGGFDLETTTALVRTTVEDGAYGLYVLTPVARVLLWDAHFGISTPESVLSASIRSAYAWADR